MTAQGIKSWKLLVVVLLVKHEAEYLKKNADSVKGYQLLALRIKM